MSAEGNAPERVGGNVRQGEIRLNQDEQGPAQNAERRQRPAARIGRGQLIFALFVLFGINTMNFYDRQVLGVVGQPLAEEWQLDDTQLGQLGTAFVLLYAAVGVPLGRWADVGRRKLILAGGVTLWSVLTLLSAFAQNFTQLFMLRLGVGVGEASCAPAANSLLGDLFGQQSRGRAISLFMLGLPVGLGLSFIVSGHLAQQYGWRTALLIAGLPGLLFGLLALAVPEPPRGAAETHAIGAARREGSALLAVLRIPTMWWIILSGALHNFNMYALGHFLAPYLARVHGLTISQAGWIGGVVYGIFGGMGLLLGGWACDRVVRKRISGRLEVATLAMLVAAPCIYLALRQPSGQVWTFAAWMLPGCLLLYVYYASVYATIQDIVEPSLRGTAMAMYFFAMYLLGGALGPFATGWLSDHFAVQAAIALGLSRTDPAVKAAGLHDAMYVIPMLAAVLVVVLFAASRTVTRDYQRLQQWMRNQEPGA